MGLFDIFSKKPAFPACNNTEVDAMINELIQIGNSEGFLSERPGSPFNAQCRHTRVREIGKRLSEIGNYPLMEYAYRRVKRKLGNTLAAHLEYAWMDIDGWMA